MVYTNTIENFNFLVEKMKNNYSKYSIFIQYFENHWLNCVDMWAQPYREKLYNLGETTNNRIESLNSHLKELGNY